MVAADLAQCELHHQDETHLDTNPYLCRMWHRRGQQAALPAAGTTRRLTTFGSVEVFGRGRVEVLCADQSSAGFQLYLEALDQPHTATGRAIIPVFDTGSAQCRQVTQAALQERAAWWHVIPLARSCPPLNKKEREWRILKRDARSHLAHSLRQFADEILAGLRWLGGERLAIVDRVPDWFIAGHRRPPRPHLGRPKGAKDLRPRARPRRNLPADT